MRKARSCPPGATTAVFVEGGDEERLCRALLGARADAVFWMTFDGPTPQNIRDRVQAAQGEPNWPGIRRIGIVIDAEERFADAQVSVSVACTELGIPVPGTSGVVEAHATGRAGYYVLPDNAGLGALETLLRRTADPVAAACVDALFRCTPNPGATAAQRDKAWLAAYLAARCGNPRVDQAWGNKGLDPAHAALDPLRAFLHALL